uniref:THAP-type domain-containing protein n=1 Tax=Strongyloides papillosus TaxID=174720 RepID=A0A0N5C0U4_STREA
MLARCPECFDSQNPGGSRRIPVANFERHFSLYHNTEYKRLKKKYLCVEDSCIEARGARAGRSFLLEYHPSSYKKHLLKKHFNSSSIANNAENLMEVDDIETLNVVEIENQIITGIDNAENLNSAEVDDQIPVENENEINRIWNFDEEFDFVETLSTENRKAMPSTISEWEKYYKKLILKFFDGCPGTEKCFKQLKELLNDAILPFKNAEVANAKSGLMKISCSSIIKEGKSLVRNFDITNPDEIILPSDDVDGNPVRRDKNLFYYLPLEESVPILMKKMKLPSVNKVKLILYADDIQANNALGSHRATGSFLHFFDGCPGTEKYFKQLKELLNDAILSFKNAEVANAKSGLMKISCSSIIKEGKSLVRNFDVTNPDEIILPSIDVDGNPVRRDKNLFYYLPLEESVPILMKKMNLPSVDKVKLILYADDIQANNVLGSHRATGSFLHVAYKIFVPDNKEVMIATSKVTNIHTIGIVLSETTKLAKYDRLMNKIINEIENLRIRYKGNDVNFELFAIAGDHVFLQDLYHLPKSFNGLGGSCCRTCMIENRHFIEKNKCREVNDPAVLRYHNFEGSMKYPFNQYSDPFHDLLEGILPDCIYSCCQKLSFFDNNWTMKSELSTVDWLEVERQIRIINRQDKKSQNILTVIRDGFFVQRISKDNLQRKDSFQLSGSEQLSLGRSLWKLLNSSEGLQLFSQVDTIVFIKSRKLLAKILSIFQMVMVKKEMSDSDIDLLEKEIDEFHLLYFDFMPIDSRCTLKLHSLLHYPLFGRMYRAFLLISCIRFESSNRRIKKLHGISCNKVNPSFTIMGKVGMNLLAEKSLRD